MKLSFLIIFLLLVYSITVAQVIGTSLPKKIVKSETYLFYQHGGVVTGRGDRAVNQSMPEWGPYEYNSILDSMRERGFNVISEVRQEGVDDATYSEKIASQIDTLLSWGVKPRNILIVGASAGWNIALLVSARLKNDSVHFVIMGGCWPETYKDFTNFDLRGHLLSIIEASDPHGTCSQIFATHQDLKSKKEIVLNTGLSHGFIYKGYKSWLDPLMNWYFNSSD